MVRKVAFLALALFIASIPFQETFTEGIQQYVGSIPRLVGLAAFIVGVTAIIFEARFRPIGTIHVWILLFMGWSAFSYVWSEAIDKTWAQAFTYGQMLAMVWLISQFAQTKDEQKGLLGAYVIGCSIILGTVYYNYLSGRLIGGASAYRIMYARYGAFLNDPNELALGLAIGLPFAWYLFVEQVRRLRWIGLAYVPLATMGIAMTGSRGGALSATAGLLIIPLTFRKVSRSWRLLIVGAVVVTAVAFVSVVPASSLDRILLLTNMIEERQTYVSTSLEDADIRVIIWKQGLLTFLDNAALGVGAGAFEDGVEPIYGERRVAHSVWVSVLTELGVIGFIFWLGVIGLCLYSMRLMERTERYAWMVAFLTWGVGASFLTWEHTKNTWMLFGMVAARAVLLNSQKKKQTAPAPVTFSPGAGRRVPLYV